MNNLDAIQDNNDTHYHEIYWFEGILDPEDSVR